ncbi:hypothetical protein [Salinivibrio costicola]|uniref:hypothetical protein n=1 Tax=Salinivibrio costicola TaxID=51367 RepID=UPI003F72D1A7
MRVGVSMRMGVIFIWLISAVSFAADYQHNSDAKEIDLWLVLVIIFTVVFLGGIALRFKRLMKDKNDIEAALITSRKKRRKRRKSKLIFWQR